MNCGYLVLSAVTRADVTLDLLTRKSVGIELTGTALCGRPVQLGIRELQDRDGLILRGSDFHYCDCSSGDETAFYCIFTPTPETLDAMVRELGVWPGVTQVRIDFGTCNARRAVRLYGTSEKRPQDLRDAQWFAHHGQHGTPMALAGA